MSIKKGNRFRKFCYLLILIGRGDLIFNFKLSSLYSTFKLGNISCKGSHLYPTGFTTKFTSKLFRGIKADSLFLLTVYSHFFITRVIKNSGFNFLFRNTNFLLWKKFNRFTVAATANRTSLNHSYYGFTRVRNSLMELLPS